jgi:predicted small secreted protein
MFFIINRKGRFLKMKNKWFMGIGVLLVFGFVLAGCATSNGGGGSDLPGGGGEPVEGNGTDTVVISGVEAVVTVSS